MGKKNRSGSLGFKRGYRLLNIASLILLIALLGTHGIYAAYAHATAESWEEHVFVIEKDWQYKLLNPLAGSALGFTVAPLSVAYVNQQATEVLDTDWEAVRRHEAKHIEQIKEMGLIRYFQIEEWKREGVAEYVRGKPTLAVCGQANGTPGQQAYREYFVVTRFLIEEVGLSEDEIYAYESYPHLEAEEWLRDRVCTKGKDANENEHP